MQNPFLYADFFYKFSNIKRRFDKLLKIAQEITDSVISKRRKELIKIDASQTSPEKEDNIEEKKKMVFMDILLKSTIDGKPLSNADIREEVITFMFAGHDTVATQISFCLYNLAKNPEIQQKAFEEVRNVMGDDFNKPGVLFDLNSMNYLEMVVKETLRLFPISAFFARKLEENFDLSKT
jgi:cytochrome P450 family 4